MAYCYNIYFRWAVMVRDIPQNILHTISYTSMLAYTTTHTHVSKEPAAHTTHMLTTHLSLPLPLQPLLLPMPLLLRTCILRPTCYKVPTTHDLPSTLHNPPPTINDTLSTSASVAMCYGIHPAVCHSHNKRDCK